MHILFLSDNFPPEVNAPASRTYEHCREWVKAGHRVSVVTCVPNFPRGKVFAGYRNRVWQREVMDGIEVIRVWSFITANEGFALRTLDFLSYMASATIAAPFVRDVDVIVATSPQFFTAVAGYLSSRIKRVPFVFELRDLWPESIRAVGAMRDGAVLRGLERLELFLYRKAAAIVAVTHSFRDNLVARGIAADKIHVVTNGVDLRRFRPQPRDEALARRLGLEGAFVAGYIGTHGMAHGLETVLEAACLVQQQGGGDIRILLLGDGARKQALKRRAAEMKLDNVLFLDSVAKEEVVRYWSLLDCAIVHLRKTPLFETVIPSKLFESFGMGVPVVHGVAGESAQIVRRAQAGIVFEPENAQQLADALLRLAGDAQLHARLREAARKAARLHDRRVLAQRMLQVLQRHARRR